MSAHSWKDWLIGLIVTLAAIGMGVGIASLLPSISRGLSTDAAATSTASSSSSESGRMLRFRDDERGVTCYAPPPGSGSGGFACIADRPACSARSEMVPR